MNASKLIIPKICISNTAEAKKQRNDHHFLTWSSITSAAPSPPVENVSIVQNEEYDTKEKKNTKKNILKTNNVEIDTDFRQENNVNNPHSEENIHLYERFKESVELLLV
jgi:hypothetical protein